MSKLNTSNITVPTIATMTEHLVDSNPHPQYLLTSELLTAVSNSIHLGDLADVVLGAGIPDNSLIVYKNGTWSNITASTLFESTIIPYATTATNGVVRLTPVSNIYDTDFSTVITPGVLYAWGNGQGYVTSNRFKETVSLVYANPESKIAVDLGQINNVNITGSSGAEAGQVLMFGSDNKWHNSSVASAKANTSTYGSVQIATQAEILSGTSQTFEEMESYGHKVPSLASIRAITGEQFISRINVTSQGSIEIFSALTGSSSPMSGNRVISTIVNNSGILASHVINGGILIGNGGSILSANVSAAINDVGASAGGRNFITISGGCGAYSLTAGRYGVITAKNGAHIHDVLLTEGVVGDSKIYTPFSNYLNIEGYAHVAHVVNGKNYPESEVSQIIAANIGTNKFHQGYVNVSSAGCLEHCIVNACADLTVNVAAKAYHVTLRGTSARLTALGYVEDLNMYSGGIVIISSGGEVNGLAAYEHCTVSVCAGGKLFGFVKYGDVDVISGPGAEIHTVKFVQSDIVIYSNASGSNIHFTSDEIVHTSSIMLQFTASNHPCGVRKMARAGESGYTHKFYPIAVDTRKPNATNSDYNDYTMDVTGLPIWDAVSSGLADTTWYITF